MTFEDLAKDAPNKFITEKMVGLVKNKLMLGNTYSKKDRKRYKKILKLIEKLEDKKILEGLVTFTSTHTGRTMQVKRYSRLALPSDIDTFNPLEGA